MRNTITLVIAIFCCSLLNAQSLKSSKKFTLKLPVEHADAPAIITITDSIYDKIHLEDAGLERDIFYQAYKGYLYLVSKQKLNNTDYLTIVDYSQSSNSKRMYVIDLNNGYLLYQSLVSHGKNSGGEFPNSFSNEKDSNKSSVGFLITGEVYVGSNGTALKLDGAEKGINDNVRNRDIVLHGSDFVNDKTINNRGVIGRSLGCPAVPKTMHAKIIKAIKNGSCFFIYHPNNLYAKKSKIINTTISGITIATATLNTTASNTTKQETNINKAKEDITTTVCSNN